MTRLAVGWRCSGDIVRRRGRVSSDCASLGLVADGLVICQWTDAGSVWRLDGHHFEDCPRRRV